MTAGPVPLTRSSLAAAVRVLTARDGDLAAVVDCHGPPPLWARPPGFVTLVHIILEQQVSLASARAALERLQQGLGALQPATIAALNPDALRRLGLTRQKAAYCHHLATLIDRGTLRLDALSTLDDGSVREALTEVRGIGPWTADIYLLMALGRPDIWPDGDLALVSALAEVKGLASRPNVETARDLVRSWSPWRSVAARILWHHYLSTRAK